MVAINTFLDERRVDPATLADQPLIALEHVEDEIRSLVARLSDPERAKRMGAEIPRSILLHGPAGIGKTHTARALARRLGDLPVYEVGADSLTAPIVRATFAELDRRHARSILVIDEIDLVGGERSEADAGTRRTLAALLTALDGLQTASGVLVVAATSQWESDLDPALLRAGRLGFILEIRHPDEKARRALLEHFLSPRPLAGDIDLGPLAEMSEWSTPADLRAACVDAAGIALAAGRDVIAQEDLIAAFERAGRVLPAITDPGPLDLAVLRRVCVHEAAHAVVGAVLHGVDWLQSVHIGPRAGRVELAPHPEGDEAFDETSARDALVSLHAGFVAERLLLGAATLSHRNDIEVATDIARRLVVAGLDPAVPPVDDGLLRGAVASGRIAEAVLVLLAGARDRAAAIVAAQRVAVEVVARTLFEEVRPKLEADRRRDPVHVEIEPFRATVRALLEMPERAEEEAAA